MDATLCNRRPLPALAFSACLALAAGLGLMVPGRAIAGEPVPRHSAASAVDIHRNLSYFAGDEADAVRHQLDVYVPKDQKDFPVVFLVHGGAWMIGDKNFFGTYGAVGKFLAEQGIGAVLPNYRLSPGVQHPEHVKDVARAFAWTVKNIERYGGRPDRIVVGGHSAGAHLVSLLATDETYLKAEGLDRSSIKGVMAVSGVYRILPNDPEITLEDNRVKEAPMQDGNGAESRPAGNGTELRFRMNLFAPVFGTDPRVRADASPINHVHKGLPPFLILTADNDLTGLEEMADQFDKALKDAGCTTERVCVKDRSHFSVVTRATRPDDPAAAALLAFVRKTTQAK
jgi:acetyl esterase/lipase